MRPAEAPGTYGLLRAPPPPTGAIANGRADRQDRAMPAPHPPPLIGVTADWWLIDDRPFHIVGDKYARSISLAAGGIPFLIPALGSLHDPRDWIAHMDGLLLTGSPSNVHPSRYGMPPIPEAEPHDETRDETTLPLIRAALAEDLPLLAICRGMQELNVALGGTLHARVHEIAGRDDHRKPSHDDPDVQYGPRHPVRLTKGGAFEAILGQQEIQVNSLHWQAIDRLAEGLVVEARAPDGTIEAVAVRGARFALGVQWHPEYKVQANALSVRLYEAFGAAVRERALSRAAGGQRVPARRTAASG
jgi:putative glutamine amidotransferase